MRNYQGGETVTAGFYWNRGAWGAEVIPAGGAALPGAPEQAYVRIPWPALLVIAPVMGGAFASAWDARSSVRTTGRHMAILRGTEQL
jgi:hypothetical protein